MNDCDLLVIGAGIAGASAAYEFAAARRVILLEREAAPGYHATGRSAAFYTESYGNRAIRALTIATGPFLRDPPAGFATHPLLRPRGDLLIARPDQEEALAQAESAARAFGLPVRMLDAAAARALVPVLAPGYAAAALHDPTGCDIDVHALHQGFLRGLKARGGRLATDAEVMALDRREGLWHARTRAGLFAAPLLLNAAGAWADEVAKLAGLPPIGLMPLRRTAFAFEAPAGLDGRDWPLLADVEERFYVKPDAGRFIGSPADETPSPPCDAQAEELDIAVAVDRIEQATTFRIRRILSRWAGLRSFVPDRTPVAGPDPLEPSFLWLAGQGGYGIQTSAALAAAAVALADGRDLPPALRELGLSAAALAAARLAR